VRHNPIEADIRQYFWSLVDKNGPLPDPATGVKSKCRLWLGSVTDQGYGRFRSGGETYMATRYAWQEMGKPDLIRKLYTKGNVTQRALAERFGMWTSNVKRILARRSWKHI
jgi:hypothetical protein